MLLMINLGGWKPPAAAPCYSARSLSSQPHCRRNFCASLRITALNESVAAAPLESTLESSSRPIGNLEAEVAAGRFRDDLYYRLNEISIALPPLRERAQDVLPFAESMLKAISCKAGGPKLSLSRRAGRSFGQLSMAR